jgi:hypothetical protein
MALMTEWVPNERSYKWFGPYVVLGRTLTPPEEDNGRDIVRGFVDSGRMR